MIVTLIALCVLGVLLGRWQNSARSQSRLDPVSRTIHTVVNPIAHSIDAAWDNIGDFFDGLGRSQSLVAENRRLRTLARVAAQYTETEKRLTQKIDQLRKMMGYQPEPGRKRIAADVIRYFPHENKITISTGSRQGVTPNLAVVTADGLVGVVQVVEANRSEVLLVTSPIQKVGAVALRDPPQPGILRGETATRLLLDFVDTRTPLQVGDLVVTSGLSDTIPRGIEIGKIIQVEQDPDFGVRRAVVFPNVQMGQIREVMVLK